MSDETFDFWRDDEPEKKRKETGRGSAEREPEAPLQDALDVRAEPDETIEPFVPTDAYRGRIRGSKKRHAKKRRAVWLALLCAGVLLLCAGGVYAHKLLNHPGAFFASATPTPKAEIVQVEGSTASVAAPTPTPEPTPTPDPYDVIYAQADTSMMQNIVNVLLIGVDYAEERETWNGKHDYHADVMMVLAINFDENRVDMISLPRDTYANIPGVKGIYKLNAAINCGGGFDAEGGAGFLKCCETASWMLGGIPVDYYYAVTMPAVKQLVDTVGGVDYDLELSFSMVGRNYYKGMQHLDGQGVLDYLRVRKNVQGSGDLNRINRQKQMLIALFKTMQDQNLVLKIPDIVSSFEGQLYTNCTLNQTMALSVFAYNLSSENIGMYSMGGTMKNIFSWNFCLTDQKNRVEIIKTVYGVDKEQYREYSSTYAQYRWADMVAERYLDTTASFTSYLKTISPADLQGAVAGTPDDYGPDGASQTGGQTEGTVRLGLVGPGVLNENGDGEDAEGGDGTGDATQTPEVVGTDLYQMYYDYFTVYETLQQLRAEASTQAQRYAASKSNSLSDYVSQMNDYASTLKSYALELAAATGYSTGKFSWTYSYWKDSSFNEVYVDFR